MQFTIKKNNQRNRQRGDTMIEVLIATAIVSFVLAAAYVLANGNVRTLQDTQEHGEAIKLVQAQTEFIRAEGGPTANCFANNGASTNSCTFNADGTYSPAGRYTLKVYKDAAQTHCKSQAYTVLATWATLKNSTGSVTICFRPVGP